MCFQVVARQQGQNVAPNQQIRMSSPTHLKNFRDRLSATASFVAATAVTGAVNSMQQPSSKRTAAQIAASASQARQQRIERLREQRQLSQGSQAVAAEPVVQLAKATNRGGAGTQKKCSACGMHKSKTTGHTHSSCPTHCLKCKQPWQTADKSCSCQP